MPGFARADSFKAQRLPCRGLGLTQPKPPPLQTSASEQGLGSGAASAAPQMGLSDLPHKGSLHPLGSPLSWACWDTSDKPVLWLGAAGTTALLKGAQELGLGISGDASLP